MNNQKNMEIPAKVRNAMKDELSHYKGSIEYLGIYKGKTAWQFGYSEPVCVGLLSIYLFDGEIVEYLCGEEAFSIISHLQK